MKSKYCRLALLMLVVIGFYMQLAAQGYPRSQPKKKGGKWGIVSNKDWVVGPEYDKIEYKKAGPRSLMMLYFAWKDNKLDVYYPGNFQAIVTNVNMEDTVYMPGFAELFSMNIIPVLENKKCGWKYNGKSVAPAFDSIFLHYDYRIGKYIEHEVTVYSNGLMGLMSRNGEQLLPPGNYTEAAYWGGFSITYRKDKKTGQLLEGRYFGKNIEIPPLYTIVEWVMNVTLNGVYISHENKEIPSFYRCELPSGGVDYFIEKDTGMARLPAALAAADQSARDEKERQRKNAIIAEARKRAWVRGMTLFAKGGAVGIKDSSGKIFLPAQATALEFGRFSIDPDDDSIHVKLVDKYSDGRYTLEWSYKKEIPVTAFISDNENISQFSITAEINPYNSITADYKLYFDEVLDIGFDYRSGFYPNKRGCPLCEGSGKLPDGYDVQRQNITYDRIVKDGTTTITRKNYLANERVGANGQLYVPTYEQSFDNYKTVKETKTVTTSTKRYKTCTLCDGKKTFKFGIINWDEARKEYVLKSLVF